MQQIQLKKGEMNVYDFGAIKLHAYKTNDLINDEVFIVEKNGNAVIIEAPCFFDNIEELTNYIEDSKMQVAGMLLAYHMAGASFLPKVPVYATSNADEYGHHGGGHQLVTKFSNLFGAGFDASTYTVTNTINEGSLKIADIEFIITQTHDAYDIEIPEINAVYIHMMGHDCHSFVCNDDHCHAITSQLQGFIDKKYDLILTSHYTPETLKDANEKIKYLETIERIAKQSEDKETFLQEVNKAFPQYIGQNYLDMTASFFFD